MSAETERESIRAKAEEIHQLIVRTDKNLADLPFRSETETMRVAMMELQTQLHRMERNLQTLLEREEEMKASETTMKNQSEV